LHDVARAIWAEQRPGYIEIHRDMVDRVIEVPDDIIEWDGCFTFGHRTRKKARRGAAKPRACTTNRKKPVVIAGIEIHRYKASRELIDLAEKLGAPMLRTYWAKARSRWITRSTWRTRRSDQPAPVVARMDEPTS